MVGIYYCYFYYIFTMGVPAFFRWLTIRYPKVVMDAISFDELECLQSEFNKETASDPNQILLDDDRQLMQQELMEQRMQSHNPEFDILYLDMNGIIHPCTSPQDKVSPF